MRLQTNGLIDTHVLYCQYLQASNLTLQNYATRALWESLFHAKVATKNVFAVCPHWPDDEEDHEKPFSLVVGHFDRELETRMIHALVKFERPDAEQADLADMEEQLQTHIEYLFERQTERSAKQQVWSAVTFGTKIRAWVCRYVNASASEREVATEPVWGGAHKTETEFYRDLGNMQDAEDIRKFFDDVTSDVESCYRASRSLDT